MIDIPIPEKQINSESNEGRSYYKSKDEIYVGGHTAQIEYRKSDTLLLTTVYGPHTCTQYFKKDDERWIIDVKCKFPASIRDDPIEAELQKQLKSTLETCLKSKNYPGWVITVVIDICSVHSELAKPLLFSHCFNSVMYCFNKASIALKINGLALTYAFKEEEKDSNITENPNEEEFEKSDSTLCFITNPFEDDDNYIEIIPHKGFVDFAVIVSESFLQSIKSQCSRYVSNTGLFEVLAE